MKNITNIRKSILSVSLMFTLSIASVLPAAASTIDAGASAGKNSVTVNGTLDVARANGSLFVQMLEVGDVDHDGKENECIFMAYTNSYLKDDKVVYKFDEEFLPSTLSTGDYKLILSGEDIEDAIVYEFRYSNPAEVVNALEDVRDASTDESTAAETAEAIVDNAGVLSIDLTNYNRVIAKDANNKGRDSMVKVLKNIDYSSLPESMEEDDAARKVEELMATFEDNYSLAEAVGLFTIADSVGDVSEWIYTYYDKYGFADGHDNDNGADETDLMENADDGTESYYLGLVDSKDDFVKHIKEYDGLPDIPMDEDDIKREIKKHIFKSALLAVVRYEAYSIVEDVLLNDEFISNYFNGLDKAGFKALRKAEDSKNNSQTKVLNYIRGKHYDRCEELVDIFNDAVDGYYDDNDDNDDNSGSGSGGSGNSSNSKPGGGNSNGNLYMPQQSEAIEESSVSFSDIDDVAWAKDAILYLNKRGVINGYPDGSFAPNDAVTRAEFIKMVSVAMGATQVEGQSQFNDVSAEDWFEPYVVSAAVNGLITGDENGCFNPNEPIARQDMVTILYRMLGTNVTTEVVIFDDGGLISDYAKDAVAYFAANGIVNGVSDGIFAPLDNATRAQTAVILYRVMNK